MPQEDFQTLLNVYGLPVRLIFSTFSGANLCGRTYLQNAVEDATEEACDRGRSQPRGVSNRGKTRIDSISVPQIIHHVIST